MDDLLPDSPHKRTKLKADWDAVERDYRTGSFTLRELSDKYGIRHQTISDRAKRHNWTKDLSLAIKQATNDALASQLVANNAARTGQNLANTVLAIAEINKQVILSHRNKLTDLADAIDFARNTVFRVGENIQDIKEAAVLVQAINGLATSTKTLIDKERESFKLDENTEAKSSAVSELLACIGRSAFPVAR